MANLEPTEDQLRAAWAELAKSDWGQFEDARRAYLHWKLVHAVALERLNRRRVPVTQRTEVEPHGPEGHARTSSWGSMKVPHQLPILDRKRAASGEREDD